MSTAKHTPGPWTVSDHWNDPYMKCIDAETHGALAEVVYRMEYDEAPSGELKANIALIAAAPDLLEALEDALAGWMYIRAVYGDLYGVGWDRVEQKATAAIAKAKGE